MPDDYAFLQRIETSEDLGVRWRLRGATPGPVEWAEGLWESVLLQYLVVEPNANQPVGLVAIYKPNHRDEHAHLAAARFNPADRGPLMALGLTLFVRYVFRNWKFRKLYMDVPEYNLSQLASGVDRHFVVEGRMREHYFADGQWWDNIVMAIYREHWQQGGERLIATSGRLPTPASLQGVVREHR